MSGFAVIDFETTGFVPERTDRVVEVGLVLLDAEGHREDSWTTLVNPRRDVGATHIHGITAGELLDAPEFGDIGDELLERVAGRTVVAHNASFDMRFLHQELLRAGYGIDERPRALCSMKWSGRLLGPAKLEHCCEALGIPLDDAHTALADAEATAQLLAHLMRQGQTLADWQADQFASRSFRWPASRQTAARQQSAHQQSAPQQSTPRLTTRSLQSERLPHSWMSDILSDTWVPGASEDEAAYLVALNNALLDFDISVTEGRSLTEIAQFSGLSSERLLELHREHLARLAAEAWSDGVLTDDELTCLCSAAASMGLTAADVEAALSAAKDVRSEPRESLLQPGDRVVFTGTLAKPREDWIAEIVAAGLATGGVTRSTRALVAADPDSLSGKAAKARSYGLPVLSEAAFERYFAEYRDLDRPMAL